MVYRRDPTAEILDGYKPLYHCVDTVYDCRCPLPSFYLGRTLPDIGLDRSLSVAICLVND
jgi:hypothetical protein